LIISPAVEEPVGPFSITVTESAEVTRVTIKGEFDFTDRVSAALVSGPTSSEISHETYRSGPLWSASNMPPALATTERGYRTSRASRCGRNDATGGGAVGVLTAGPVSDADNSNPSPALPSRKSVCGDHRRRASHSHAQVLSAMRRWLPQQQPGVADGALERWRATVFGHIELMPRAGRSAGGLWVLLRAGERRLAKPTVAHTVRTSRPTLLCVEHICFART
jgi:hypothetical protein